MSAILITGASGYIGGQLSKKLSENHLVFKVGRKKDDYTWFTWEELPNTKVDTVIHLAGKAHDTTNGFYAEYYQANVTSTKNIIDYCNRNKVNHLIYLSTSKVYANNDSLITESCKKQAANSYQKTKLIAEHLIRTELMDTKYHILQPPIVMSQKEKGNINQLHKLFSILPFWPLGAFKNRKSIISYKNLEFFIEQLILKQPESNTYIVCDDNESSTIGIIQHKFPKVKVVNTGKGFWIILARLLSFLKIKLFDKEALDKIIKSEIYSNEKIKKDLKVNKTKYDISQSA